MNRQEERRHAPRVNNAFAFYVADYDEVSFPDSRDFRPAEGRDVSTTGISFIRDEPAELGQKLIIVAPANAAICVVACVVRCTEVVDEYRHLGKYIVGCALERRIQRDSE